MMRFSGYILVYQGLACSFRIAGSQILNVGIISVEKRKLTDFEFHLELDKDRCFGFSI